MKTKFELSVSISPEEHEVLAEAGHILQDICFVFEEHGQCDMCPIHAICSKKLNGVSTPQSILYDVQKVLKVEREG